MEETKQMKKRDRVCAHPIVDFGCERWNQLDRLFHVCVCVCVYGARQTNIPIDIKWSNQTCVQEFIDPLFRSPFFFFFAHCCLSVSHHERIGRYGWILNSGMVCFKWMCRCITVADNNHVVIISIVEHNRNESMHWWTQININTMESSQNGGECRTVELNRRNEINDSTTTYVHFL